MQPQNADQWNLRYLISEAIRTGQKLSLDELGNILVDGNYNGPPLLSEQTTQTIADGKRRGFNGKQPRVRDGVSHPCKVTTADGREYIFSKRTKSATLDSKQVINAANLAPSNGGNPDA